MPLSTKLYRISDPSHPPEYNLQKIQKPLSGWEVKEEISLETDEVLILKRNFKKVRFKKDRLLWGTYQIDVPISAKERAGPTRTMLNFEEFDFFIKPNGKTLFFGSKNRGGDFYSDLSQCLSEKGPAGHTCEEQPIPESVLRCLADSPLNVFISGAGFKGAISKFISKESLGGVNLQDSREFSRLLGMKNVTLYRLIFKLKVGQNVITVQINEEGLILGYVTKEKYSLEIMNDILDICERCGL